MARSSLLDVPVCAEVSASSELASFFGAMRLCFIEISLILLEDIKFIVSYAALTLGVIFCSFLFPRSLTSHGSNMADAMSAYGADENIVSWTLIMNGSLLSCSLLAYGMITCSSSFSRGGMWSRILSPRKHLHPMTTHPEPRNEHLFSWVYNVFKVTDNEYLMTSGLDALMTTKFHECLSKILLCCSVYGLFVLCPVFNRGKNLDANNAECKELYDKYIEEKQHYESNSTLAPPDCVISSIYTKLTMANIDKDTPAGQHNVWYAVIGAYIFVFVAFYFLTKTWEDYVKFRHVWLSRVSSSCSTVRVVDHIFLPQSIRRHICARRIHICARSVTPQD